MKIEDDSHSSYDEDEIESRDALDDFLDQYKFHFEPECRLKFQKRFGECKFGVSLVKPHGFAARSRITVKPRRLDTFAGKNFQKILILPREKLSALYSKKIKMGIFSLQFVAGYLWDQRCPTLDYRLTTVWSDGIRLKRKEQYPVPFLPSGLFRCKWNLDIDLPDVEGHIGGTQAGQGAPLDIDYGRLDFEVTQIDFVVDLDELADVWRSCSSRVPSLHVASQDLGSTPSMSKSSQAGCPPSRTAPLSHKSGHPISNYNNYCNNNSNNNNSSISYHPGTSPHSNRMSAAAGAADSQSLSRVSQSRNTSAAASAAAAAAAATSGLHGSSGSPTHLSSSGSGIGSGSGPSSQSVERSSTAGSGSRSGLYGSLGSKSGVVGKAPRGATGGEGGGGEGGGGERGSGKKVDIRTQNGSADQEKKRENDDWIAKTLSGAGIMDLKKLWDPSEGRKFILPWISV